MGFNSAFKGLISSAKLPPWKFNTYEYIANSEPPAAGTTYKNIATLRVTYVETV